MGGGTVAAGTAGCGPVPDADIGALRGIGPAYRAGSLESLVRRPRIAARGVRCARHAAPFRDTLCIDADGPVRSPDDHLRWHDQPGGPVAESRIGGAPQAPFGSARGLGDPDRGRVIPDRPVAAVARGQ